MSRLNFFRVSALLLMLVLLAIYVPAINASPATEDAVWSGQYFNNVTLDGSPALLRGDSDINFFWSEGTSPAPGYVNTTNYSVRWTRAVNFGTTGNWVFTTVNDDGMRVWVDDAITMDAWYDQGPTTHTGTIKLNAGVHTIKVEYYNRANAGTARVSWALEGTYTQWKGEYFNNQWLSGSPALTRNESDVNFNWGTGSPDAVIPSDHFSARWTRTVSTDAATYRMTVTSDDGARMWVDDVLQIDAWYDHAPTTFTRDVALSAGSHTFKIEFYESAYLAQIQFSYGKVGDTATNAWHGQYYNNMYLSGSPVMVRDDAALNFDWGTGSPGSGVPADNFSVKWDATINIGTAGNYNVVFASDDGVRVWVDGAIAIDAWYDHAPTTFTVMRYLAAGTHSVHVEYYEHTGGAMVNGQIVPANQSGNQSGSDVIVDDRGAGWQAGGCSYCWRAAWNGYGGHAFYTWNNTRVVYGYNWGRWLPTLSRAGNYEVFAYIPNGVGNTANARYWIRHAGQSNLAVRNQGANWNRWMSLGTYYFAATPDENVSLTDVTYECYLCRTLAFDAVKFSPR